MLNFKKTLVMAVFGSLLFVAGGCVSSSNLVDIWHERSLQSHPLAKMLVIAMLNDAGKRRIWEDAFAAQLSMHGIVATPSYTLFADAPPDTDAVISAVTSNGFDGVMAIFRRPTETTRHFVRGYTSTEQFVRYSPYNGPYWERYRTYYREIEHPGYIDSQTVAIRTIDVSTTGQRGVLIWSATSRTPDPLSVVDVQRDIAGLVSAQLAAQNIIGPAK